jgi:hypothetical protein
MTTEVFHQSAMDLMRSAVCRPQDLAEVATILKHLLTPWQGQRLDHLVSDQQTGGCDKEKNAFYLSRLSTALHLPIRNDMGQSTTGKNKAL